MNTEKKRIPRWAWALAVGLVFWLLLLLATFFFGPRDKETLPIPIIANARSIGITLIDYAADHGGQFPPAGKDANESLRVLFPEKLDGGSEKIFHIARDTVFCRTERSDGNIEGEKALAPGENHWAYVAGLTDKAPSETPLLANGFTAPGNRYDKRHVFWKQKSAIVAYMDGTAKVVKLKIEGDTGYVPAPNGKGNLFAPENLPPGAVVLNPALPNP